MTLSLRPFPSKLKFQLLPPTVYTLDVYHLSGPSQHRPHSPIAESRIRERQFLYPLCETIRPPLPRLVPIALSLKSQQCARSPLAHASPDHYSGRFSPITKSYHFFLSTSFITSISRSRSASSRFNRAFSCTSVRYSRTSSTSIDPNRFFHA